MDINRLFSMDSRFLQFLRDLTFYIFRQMWYTFLVYENAIFTMKEEEETYAQTICAVL